MLNKTPQKTRINLTTLGCPKNLVDSEVLLGGLGGDGVDFVDDPARAETIILNTCGFIDGAKQESIDAILEAVELKERGSCRRVFVTGCLSQRYGEELRQAIPEVDGIYGNRDMAQVIHELTTALDLKHEILGDRLLTTPRHYAYLKISEGCENPCTFCSIPGIRGDFRSRSVESLVDEAQRLADQGVKELILVAQDTTVYGRDRYGTPQLVPLLDRLSEVTGIKWLRLLYTYPAHFHDDLIDVMAEKPTICNYIDMPFQHAWDRILKSMARKVKRRDLERIIDRLRSRIPDIAIRTSLIVGFPGETERDFQELVDFVQQVRFERLGVFTYSREEDTPAYHFPNQVPEAVMRERWSELMDLQNDISREFNNRLVGSKLKVLVDAYDPKVGAYVGRTVWDCPEIDNSVILGGVVEPGQFCDVRIVDSSDYELRGVAL